MTRLTRRQFLKLTGAAAAAVTLFGPGCTSHSSETAGRRQPPDPNGDQAYLSVAQGTDPAEITKAAIAALDYDVSDLVDLYRKKRDLLYEGLSEAFELVKPGGAFYAFVKAPGSSGATAFVEKAIANNLLIIPGNVFSEKDSHFRISYATSEENIRQGMEILRELV